MSVNYKVLNKYMKRLNLDPNFGLNLTKNDPYIRVGSVNADSTLSLIFNLIFILINGGI